MTRSTSASSATPSPQRVCRDSLRLVRPLRFWRDQRWPNVTVWERHVTVWKRRGAAWLVLRTSR